MDQNDEGMADGKKSGVVSGCSVTDDGVSDAVSGVEGRVEELWDALDVFSEAAERTCSIQGI